MPKRRPVTTPPTNAEDARRPDRRTLVVGLLGSLLFYLAQPPVSWGLLAWIAPTPWLMLARLPQLTGRRPYRALWLASMAFWLVAFQWLRLPHWANYLLLLSLAAYVSVYLPVFVGLTRVAVHRCSVPLWLAAPIVWTGLEWLRARLLTGFLMASLAHTQVRFTAVIQIADVFGEYGVTFLVILVAASIAAALPLRWIDPHAPPNESPPRPWFRQIRFAHLLPAVIALAAAYAYGHYRLTDLAIQASNKRPASSPRVALIQSDLLATLKGVSPQADEDVMEQQLSLSREAVQESDRPVDLVIWPETMYRNPLWVIDPQSGPPREGIDEQALAATKRNLETQTKELNAALLVGIDRLNLVRADQPGLQISDAVPYRIQPFNSSVCVDRTGQLLGTYDKMHLLPFGEYVPFIQWLPFLQRFSPITGFAAAGRSAAAFELDGVTYSPNICYETVLPQVIRSQVVELADAGRTPDVLVNLTNDAWYEGSSELEMHLASGVFRAVEMRTPLLIAANRGLTAHIDHRGRVMAVTQRNQPAYLLADVELPPRRKPYPTLYAAYGDWLSLACLLCCIAMVAIEWRHRTREKSQ